mmetsp:Transcript_40654/g.46213  ORF Transcript_40654/g.46213 Transcript_40654/m.46213 type:complete len:433 (+) Transcript_40654:140-1438(+)|eukprot:CAMPEP_0194146728 /NCGR_PEP_ID=MMETSP0152-20130528/21516_1 /TAXON_ID=1049557 /ORGANISM="Thalassiothrix antarctica, Strain L6-D1" /LENGTH=432 /DNA_ID=CAMNT_0038847317 /DNA_START=91 /DNA_END=1389 /DNA_ORIENTATION=+
MPKVQKLFSLNEVFIYRVPPIKFAGGYRAEDWDLTKPLQTCSLSVEQLDIDACLVKFYVDRITPDGFDVALFAQCNILLSPEKRKGGLEQYLENVLDSSRYFVVKIEDLKTSRTANIGVGFREREDASNFRRTLLDFYEESIRKQDEITRRREEEEFEEDSVVHKGENKVSIYADIENEQRKLSLLDWEKIHLNVGYQMDKDDKSGNEQSAEPSNGSTKHETSSRGDASNSTEETIDDDLSSMTGIGRTDMSLDSRYDNIVPRKNRRIPDAPSSRNIRQTSLSSELNNSIAGDSDANENYLHDELNAREDQIQKLSGQLSGLQVNLQTTSGDLAKKEAETASLCQTLSKAIKYIEEYKTRVRDLEDTQTKLESELDTTKNVNATLKTERYQLEVNLGELIESSSSTKKDGKRKKKSKKGRAEQPKRTLPIRN